MTLLDIKNHLYAHFLTESTFNPDTDLGLIKMGGAYDTKDGKMARYKRPLIQTGLEEMEKSGMVQNLNGLYVLRQPLDSFTQTVTLSPYTASVVADAFNTIAREGGGVTYLASKFAVTDTDIHAVARMAMMFFLRVQELEEELDDLMAPDDDTPPGIDPSAN